MYVTTIQDIEIPFLANAAYVLSLRKDGKGEKIFKFRSLYMYPTGECAISYYGYLSEQQIKEVMINFCYPNEDKSYDDVHPVIHVDYSYNNGSLANREGISTTIYTHEGLDYRTLKI